MQEDTYRASAPPNREQTSEANIRHNLSCPETRAAVHAIANRSIPGDLLMTDAQAKDRIVPRESASRRQTRRPAQRAGSSPPAIRSGSKPAGPPIGRLDQPCSSSATNMPTG